VQGNHFHWLVRGGGQMSSQVKRGVLVRTVGRAYTTRNVKSLTKLAEKVAAA